MKSNLESILIANLYFTICNLEKSNTDAARKYLSVKINEALNGKKSIQRSFINFRNC